MFISPQTWSFTQLTHVELQLHQSNALMGINQSDITPTLVTGQHRFLSTLCFSFFCSQGQLASANMDITDVCSFSLSYHLPYPGSCCVSTDYQCNTSNKIHQPTIFPPSSTLYLHSSESKRGKKVLTVLCNINLKHEIVLNKVWQYQRKCEKTQDESETYSTQRLILKLKVISCFHLTIIIKTSEE